MIRALVTGSTGCVGANLVAALNHRDIEVIGLQRSTSPQDAVGGLRMTPVIGDILNPDSLSSAMQNVDWVFHVAAVADYWQTPDEVIYRVNVEGARNVMQAALDAGVKRFVLTGSTAALGLPQKGQKLITEENTFNLKPAEFPYGHSKHLAIEAMKEFVSRGLSAIAVLPSAVSGPRDLKFNSGELIIQVLKRGPFPVPPGGLNFIDARDVADAHIAAAERGQVGESYILAGHNMTHGETLDQVCEALERTKSGIKVPRWVLPPMAAAVDVLQKIGVSLPVDKGRVQLSGEYMYYDNSKAVSQLGLTPMSFVDSIRDTYRWYVETGYLSKRL